MSDEDGFERLYTMPDWYDGPRSGIAEYRGRPHHYVSRWDDLHGPRDTFELREIDEETLRLALEDWAMWLRWEAAFQARETTIETHPVLPAERARHDELAPLLRERLANLKGPVLLAHAEFRSTESGSIEVRWELLAPTPT